MIIGKARNEGCIDVHTEGKPQSFSNSFGRYRNFILHSSSDLFRSAVGSEYEKRTYFIVGTKKVCMKRRGFSNNANKCDCRYGGNGNESLFNSGLCVYNAERYLNERRTLH